MGGGVGVGRRAFVERERNLLLTQIVLIFLNILFNLAWYDDDGDDDNDDIQYNFLRFIGFVCVWISYLCMCVRMYVRKILIKPYVMISLTFYYLRGSQWRFFLYREATCYEEIFKLFNKLLTYKDIHTYVHMYKYE